MIALYAPNSIQIFGSYKKDVALIDGYSEMAESKVSGLLTWKATRGCALVMAVVSIFALWCRYEVTEFLYFQF